MASTHTGRVLTLNWQVWVVTVAVLVAVLLIGSLGW
jgi:hypothetical protein